MENIITFEAFCDVHVHFREPGFSQKETIGTGCMAAARGGYSDVCTMPNLNPVPDSPENLSAQMSLIDAYRSTGGCGVRVHPYASITVGERGEELVDFEALAPHVIAFSDDGRGVQDGKVMEEAMRRAKDLGKMIVAHCEDNSLLRGGYINDGPYAAAHGHAGICAQSEWGPIARDLDLAAKTGCAYHVCHISTAKSAELIRQAKSSGVDVTCETAPHYLLLDETFLREEGRFKMNPPLRLPDDREALVEALADGSIDMVATDHAPHTAAEKSRGLAHSPFGIVGLETAFPLLYTYLVRSGAITLERLLQAMGDAPRARFGIPAGDSTCTWDLDCRYKVNPAEFASMGHSTPFEDWKVYGRCLRTVVEGEVAYEAH